VRNQPRILMENTNENKTFLTRKSSGEEKTYEPEE
jgi:hypothetical protein